MRCFSQVEPDKRLSAKEILEARWFTEDIEAVNSALEVGDHFKSCDQLVVWKVMGLDELDSIPSEEEVDREDSGEDYYPIAFRYCLDLFPEEEKNLHLRS